MRDACQTLRMRNTMTADILDFEGEASQRRPYRGVAVLVPCLDEAPTVARVVTGFRETLPGCTVYVYDNGSSDATVALARDAGAVVRVEPRRGKGNVVRQMLRDVEADCYLMVDGDDTYPPEAAPAMVGPVLAGVADMVAGDRLSNGSYSSENRRPGHGFGNELVRRAIGVLYGRTLRDVMTGYRAMSRPFAKTLPVLSQGFQLETEVSIWAIDRRWRVLEVPIDYRDRPQGSASKLDTVPDGVRVLRCIGSLLKDYKPLTFFGALALALMAAGLTLGIPVIVEFGRTHLVERLPTAICAVALCGLAALMLVCGLVLDTVAKSERRLWELEAMRACREDAARRFGKSGPPVVAGREPHARP